MLIDSHCHLTYEPLAKMVDAVLARAAAAGVTNCVTIGTSLPDVSAAIDLGRRHCNVFATAGIHPHEAGKAPGGWESELRRLAADTRVVAIGETGLDYHYDFSPRGRQRAVFERQLALAVECGKPVVIHCREAHDDVVGVLDGVGGLKGVVFHCFTGTVAEAREILERGWWISLTGVVTFRNAGELAEVARLLPGDRLMVETDAPYLSPEPVRNVRPNEPAHVVHIARRIADLRGETFEDVAVRTRANTIRFFELPLD
jgi:TatD DNase family protein